MNNALMPGSKAPEDDFGDDPLEFYRTLDVPSGASLREIRAAFRRAAKLAHPDAAGGSAEAFLKLQRAFSVLSNPELREKYDLHGMVDEGALKSVEEEATQEMMKRLFGTMAEAFNGNPAAEDIIATMAESVDRDIKTHRAIAGNVEKIVAYCEKAKKRIRRKDRGESIFDPAIDSHIRAARESQEKHLRAVRVLSIVRERLRHYESPADLMTAARIMTWTDLSRATSTTSSTSGGNW